MDIVKIQAKYDALLAAHKDQTREDFLAHNRGEMDAAELERRHSRRLAEIAAYETGGEMEQALLACEEDREARAARRKRWHGFSFAAMRYFPYYEGLDLTKAQKAVLCAFMAAGKGKKSFAVAHQWICAKAGVSRGSVKLTLRRLEANGLIQIRERRLSGKAMNLWNMYTLKCDRLINWAFTLFSIKGSKTSPHPQKGDKTVTTAVQPEQNATVANESSNKCRQKAKQFTKRRGLDLDNETFACVARPALEELGANIDENSPPDVLLHAAETLKALYQPGFKSYFWDKFVTRHGRKRALLAFLDTQIVKRVRLGSIADERPWNEREVIRDTNRYLYGILNRPQGECRPELTLGALLLARGHDALPEPLQREIGRHMRDKSKRMQLL